MKCESGMFSCDQWATYQPQGALRFGRMIGSVTFTRYSDDFVGRPRGADTVLCEGVLSAAV